MARSKQTLPKFRLTDEDVLMSARKSGRSASKIMMDGSSVRGGTVRNKKAYQRKEKHRKNWV